MTIVSSDKSAPLTVLRGIPDPRSLRELIRARSYEASAIGAAFVAVESHGA